MSVDSDSLYSTYYNNLNANGLSGSYGYPITTSTFRKTTIVNGSLTGMKTNYGSSISNENQTYIYLRGYIDLSWWFINWSMTFFRNENKFIPAYGQTGKIFYGYQFPPDSYSLFVTNNDKRGSMDVIPGGFFDSHDQLKEQIIEGLRKRNIRHELRDYFPIHSFIPTFSSLGIKNPDRNWAESLQRNLVCTNETPFDSYYGTSENTQHTSFTEQSVNWLMKELDGIPQAPSFPIVAEQFTGPNIICENQVATYSFPDICKLPGKVSWEISDPTVQIISSTDTAITLKGTNNGLVILTADFENGQVLTKKIWIGKPKIYFYQFEDNPTHAYIGSAVNGATLADQGLNPSQVIWRRLPGTFTKSGYSFLITTTIPEFDVEIKATNDCGTTTLQETVIYSPICNNYNIVKTSENNYDIVDPCPPGNPTQSTLKMDDITIIVVDINGREVVHTKDLHFSLQSQLPGLYISRIIKNGQIVHSQNLIKN